VKENCKLVAGGSNLELANQVSKLMKIPLMPIDLKQFSDGELYCRILESVRGSDVYIIQSTSPDVNHNLMELLIISDALKRSSPINITAVVPYFGYCRQDKKHKSREPITAKLVANMMMVAGINRLITFDLHAAPVQGFFDIPSDNLEVMPLFAEYIVDKGLKDIVIVSPDAGGVTRARAMATELNVPIAIVDKRRPSQNVAEVLNVIGDVNGRTAIIIDDIIDTAGSIVAATDLLIKHGAKDVYAFASHALLSGEAVSRLENSPVKEVIVTDTISIPKEKQFNKLKIISVGYILAEAISRTNKGKPMGVVYEDMMKKIQEKTTN
tara:strand:- start:579 stop:1553 length:975 start_codon:yes stop_codon:yes gene_type:complete